MVVHVTLTVSIGVSDPVNSTTGTVDVSLIDAAVVGDALPLTSTQHASLALVLLTP